MDRAGIREVAKAAGVSISTVSRAFTRPELVSERTRRKVLETADKLDFNISRSATSLKSGQSYRVAMLMNEEITSWFNTEVFAGIESVMHNAGYDVSLFQHVDTAENRRDFFTNLPVRRNVDAVFVTSFGVDPKEIQQANGEDSRRQIHGTPGLIHAGRPHEQAAQRACQQRLAAQTAQGKSPGRIRRVRHLRQASRQDIEDTTSDERRSRRTHTSLTRR